MKRSKIVAVVLAVITCVLTVITVGCGKRLASPAGFSIDDNFILSWSTVENAKRYLIEVKNIEDGTVIQGKERTAEYSLYDLEMGDYSIRVKAVGDDVYADSDWSEVIEYSRGYDTGCVYTLINANNEYEISKVGKATGDIIIEDYRFGKPVTSIGEDAFRGNKRITSVIVGNNVKNIGINAFYSCENLVSVVLPECLQTLGQAAFQACSKLTSINIPDGITKIEPSVFSTCSSLTKLDLNNVESIGDSAFTYCVGFTEWVFNNNLKSISKNAFSGNTNIKSVTFGNSLQTLGTGAFRDCEAVETIKFSDSGSLQTIGNSAFAGCTSLQSIEIPEGVTSIGGYAFMGDMALANVSIPDSVTSIGSLAFDSTEIYNKAKDFVYADKWLVGYKEDEANPLTVINNDSFAHDTVGIASWTFAEKSSLLKVSLNASVKYLSEYAFYKCESLWQVVTADNGLISIGNCAFSACTALKSLTLGKGLQTIGALAFLQCTPLENNAYNNIIPASVTSIGNDAFRDTAIWDSPDEYGIIYAGNWVVGNAWTIQDEKGNILVNSNYSTLREVVLSNKYAPSSGATAADLRVGIADFGMCVPLYGDHGLGPTSIQGLENVNHIGTAAFFSCVRLNNVVLNSNVKEIPDFAFYNCNKLAIVNIPTQLTSIGRSAFYGCSSLNQIIHDNDATFVGLDLSHSRVKSIGDFAFYGCNRLLDINFGSYLTDLGSCAFYNCEGLKTVTVPDSITAIRPFTFSKCSSLLCVDFGSGVQKIAEYAFTGCSVLEQVTFPQNVNEIGNFAFYGCNLKSIEFGGVQKMGEYSFALNPELESLVIPSTVKSVGNFAFSYCDKLKSIIIGEGVETLGKFAFYGINNPTIYVQGQNDGKDWDSRWNVKFSSVLWGCELSGDGSYVSSFTVGNKVDNVNEETKIGAPAREGYEFVGWSAQKDSQTAEYDSKEILTLPEGTVLYTVWKIKEPESLT